MFKKIMGLFHQRGNSKSPAKTAPAPSANAQQTIQPQTTDEQNSTPLEEEQQAHKTPQDNESAFSGEHFEGLGDVWEAILGPTENFIEIAVKFALDYNFPDRSQHIDEAGNLILLTRSPAEGDMAAGVLNTREAESNELRVRSCYPLLQGHPNPLVILETHTWANGLEGAVAAQKHPNGPPLDFFAPFYFLDQKYFEQAIHEKEVLITELGAAAFSLRAAEVKEYTVNEGPLYETMLERFLKENPEKTQADFQDVTITTQGLRMLMPTQYACEWAYRCPVEALEELTFDNKPFLKLTVPLVGIDETEVRAYLYVSEAELNGYVPSVGEDIEGVLWMSGSIVHDAAEGNQVSEEQ